MQQDAKIVQEELERIREQICKLEEALTEKPDYGLGQGDPAIVRWEMNRALLAQQHARAESLEQALSRLNEGLYGVCEECGEPIHPDRLAVLPDVRVCIRCARQS